MARRSARAAARARAPLRRARSLRGRPAIKTHSALFARAPTEFETPPRARRPRRLRCAHGRVHVGMRIWPISHRVGGGRREGGSAPGRAATRGRRGALYDTIVYTRRGARRRRGPRGCPRPQRTTRSLSLSLSLARSCRSCCCCARALPICLCRCCVRAPAPAPPPSPAAAPTPLAARAPSLAASIATALLRTARDTSGTVTVLRPAWRAKLLTSRLKESANWHVSAATGDSVWKDHERHRRRASAPRGSAATPKRALGRARAQRRARAAHCGGAPSRRPLPPFPHSPRPAPPRVRSGARTQPDARERRPRCPRRSRAPASAWAAPPGGGGRPQRAPHRRARCGAPPSRHPTDATNSLQGAFARGLFRGRCSALPRVPLPLRFLPPPLPHPQGARAALKPPFPPVV